MYKCDNCGVDLDVRRRAVVTHPDASAPIELCCDCFDLMVDQSGVLQSAMATKIEAFHRPGRPPDPGWIRPRPEEENTPPPAPDPQPTPASHGMMPSDEADAPG